MIPYIVSEEEIYVDSTLFDRIKNGPIGRLTGCISCEVTEELNGQFTARIKIPMAALHASRLKRNGLVYMKACQRLGTQLFRINSINKTLSDGIVEVQLNHISYDLNKLPAKPFTAVGKTAVVNAFNNINYQTTYNPWLFHFNMETTNETSKIEVQVPKPWRSIMGGSEGSILDVFGGEWLWDNLSATLKTARGSDRDYIIEYGKNVLDFKQEESIANTYTSCIGYVKKGDDPVVIGNVVIDGDEDTDYPMVQVVDLTDKVDEDTQVTVALVTQLTEAYVNANHPRTPHISMNLSFAYIKKVAGRTVANELNTINLGDTVTVRIADMNVDAKAKVTGYTYDVLNEEYKSLSIGNYKNTLSSRISKMNRQIDSSPLYAFPVGAVFTTYSVLNPAAVLGGTWSLVSFIDDVYTYRRIG